MTNQIDYDIVSATIAQNVTNQMKFAFVNPDEWKKYNLWCIKNLENMIEEEGQKL